MLISVVRRLIKSVNWRILKVWLAIRKVLGVKGVQWARVVMDRETESYVRSMDYKSFNALEVSGSGDKWERFGFKSYQNTSYPEYDLCSGPLAREKFDIVIAEQVLEHVAHPRQSVRNAWDMLRVGGLFLVTTPFLIRVHGRHQDYSRWTEMGLRNLLVDGGFRSEDITTGAWGNRSCIRANFEDWVLWIPWLDSLENQLEFPVSVWAFAKKTARVPN